MYCFRPKRHEKLASLDVREDGDDDGIFISGLAVTRKGLLLVADSEQNTIKTISPDNKFLSVLKMESSPGAIAILDDRRVVATTEDGVLYVLGIDGRGCLSIEKEIQMDYEILSIAEYHGKLLITCDTEFKTTKLIDLNGKELWSLQAYKRENLFEHPCGVAWAVVNNKDTVIVVDGANSTITLLNATDGALIKRIRKDYMNEDETPEGISVDKDNNVYISYPDTQHICVWRNDFKEKEMFMDLDDLELVGPRTIAVSENPRGLYVSYMDEDIIERFDIG